MKINLTAIITTTIENQSIDIRWRTDVGSIYINSRILTVIEL